MGSGAAAGSTDIKSRFSDRRVAQDWLKKMADNGEGLLLQLSELEAILNQDELPFSTISSVLQLVTTRSLMDSDRTDRMYSIVASSKFMRAPRNLRSYVLKISDSKRPGPAAVADFQAIVFLVEQILDRNQASGSELPLDALTAAAQKLSEILPQRVRDALARMSKLREQKKLQTAQQYNASSWTPDHDDEDFRDISIFPTTEEILSVEAGQLPEKIRPNIVNGCYKNVMHYLDTHYRLLREDCLNPLREGIKAYIAGLGKTNEVSRDIRIYHSVRMRGLQCTRNGIVYRISFNVDCEVAWERSKRLMYGSLLCLSCDDFKTILWATVSNRDADLLNSSRRIDIRFNGGYEPAFTPENVYTMVESSTTYFEAYQHVLRALQGLQIDKFPFADYLISCESSVRPPAYLKHKTEYNMRNVFDGGRTTFPVLHEWPAAGKDIETTLDASQMAAVKQALTKELAIIQGPPGTGKTFVGLKVMRALLDNAHVRSECPILVICYTNHALDQFLEGVMGFEENIVRIGGRSKSEALQERNIRKLMFDASKQAKSGSQHHRSRVEAHQHMEQIEEAIKACVAELNTKELTVEQLQRVARPEHLKSLLNSKAARKGTAQDAITFWLAQSKVKAPPKSQRAIDESNANYRDDTKKKPGQPPSGQLDEDDEDLDNEDADVVAQLQDDRKVGEELGPTTDTNVMELKAGAFVNTDGSKLPEAIVRTNDVWQLSTPERHMLYKYWLTQYFKNFSDDSELSDLCERYEELCRARKHIEEELQIEVLQSVKVIGMTTTGVAKFQRLIQAVNPEVIIVEEAAEVLEAHIVAALSPSAKHLIIIGDHEQLRPSTAVYRLSTQFHLDVSLFERLVRNGMEQITLQRQRRMRPAVSSLIMPIYPHLENHEHVLTYPNVLGVANNIFFLHHTVEEQKTADSGSKSNPYEAAFISQLCRYLLLQGYKSEEITVLSMYSGQVFLLRKEFRNLQIGGIRITSVDNFQGEENQIIVLSLVRSNTSGEIGFLKASNRVCVALSRAKVGMFVVGNANLLLQKNELWRKVIDNFKGQRCFGTQLNLKCQNHPEKYTLVAKQEDFKHVEDGGCNKPCGGKFDCGHPCIRLCHPYPHSQLQCMKPCERVHEKCGHVCGKRCYEECGDCQMLLDKKLPCGHTELVPCCVEAEDHTCPRPCTKLLPCGLHKCPRQCGQSCATFCHTVVAKPLPCGHTAKVECSADVAKVKCTVPCLACYPGCGHRCAATCCKKAPLDHEICPQC
eukprot:TRINITY_DN7033_c0_g1_i2.p1 TRINITY_DN7033_c0_g1~~TRINITY_DN7033_c0_g1_i2.p1  ORF type:complete len:1253 (+),score=300.21 TRINITY_DN7033_c0_g1_i2:224-3982(+)